MFTEPMFRFVRDGTRIRFMRGRFAGLAVSAGLSLLSVLLFFEPGLRLGLDFAGGIVVEARTPTPADFGRIRASLAANGVSAAGVQRFGAADDVLVQLDRQRTEKATQDAVTCARRSPKPHRDRACSARMRSARRCRPSSSATDCSRSPSRC